MNGGFPPIQIINMIETKVTADNKKERFFAPITKKNVDIKKILINNIHKKMISQDNNTIEIIDSL